MENSLPDGIGEDEFIDGDRGSRISEAVIFTEEAWIKREASLSAKEGVNRFLLEVKAFAVDKDSVQATVFGKGEILSVQYRETVVRDRPQEEIRRLEEQKEELVRRQDALRAERGVLEKQVRFLDSVVGFAEVEMPNEVKARFPKTEDLKSMLAFLDDSYRDLSEKNAALAIRLRDLSKEDSLVDKKLKRLRRPKESVRKGIEVVFKSEEKQNIRIEATYVTPDAGWDPVYRVDCPLDLSGSSLTLFADIRQESGENWEEALVTVSNAVPLKGAALPLPSLWKLDFPRENHAAYAVGMAAGAAPAAMEDLAVEVFDEDMLEEAPAEFTQAVQKELPHVFEYELPRPVTIVSSGGETLLPLYTKEMEGEFFDYVLPRQDTLAYLVCRASADSALLAGKLNIHFGGRYVGATFLSEKKAGEDLLINLGVDRGIVVKREKAVDRLAETFFGRVDRSFVARELLYCITVENLKKEEADVRLVDSIPVAGTDRIQVKGVELSPQPSQRDYQNKEGVMQWKLSVPPGESTEVVIKFFVKHPKGALPAGL